MKAFKCVRVLCCFSFVLFLTLLKSDVGEYKAGTESDPSFWTETCIGRLLLESEADEGNEDVPEEEDPFGVEVEEPDEEEKEDVDEEEELLADRDPPAAVRGVCACLACDGDDEEDEDAFFFAESMQ